MVSKWSTLKEIQKHTSDWKIVKLNDFSTEAKNSFVNGPFGSDLLSSELTNEGRPVVYIRDIQKGSYRNKSNICITEEKFKSLPSCQVVFGDVIISKVGTPPCEAAIYDSKISGIVTQDVIRIRCEELSQSIFLKYLLNSDIGKRQVQQIKISGTRERVSLTDFKKIRLPQPTINEQQKIAKILSTWDNAISTIERLIDNSIQQKKALMQQLLTGKKRLLNESGKSFEGEFNQHRLSELVNIDKKSLGKNTLEDYEFEYISLSDVSTGTISKSLERHVFSSAPSRARRIVKENDLLLATVRPNLKGFAKAKKEHDGFVASTGFAVLSAKKDVSSDYVYHYLFSHHLTGQINALVVGSNYPAINSSDVGSLKILCPPLQEQQKIATVLTNADKEIELLEQQLADLQQEKKALMQVLLTGKKRVVVE